MTLPWVEPPSENEPSSIAADAASADPAASLPSHPVLSDKPVLEWTKEDWARWIDDSSPTPTADPEAVDGEEVTDEITNEAAGPALAQPGATDERPWNLDSGFPIVDIGLPDEENGESSLDPDRLWDEPPERAVKLEAPTRAESPSAAIAGATRSDREAHELAPPPLLRPVRSEPLTTWGPPASASPIGAPRTIDAGETPQNTGSAPPQPVMSAMERSHRIRSALGLLGVAVTVGVVMAVLITVTIFAVGVALRRAVG